MHKHLLTTASVLSFITAIGHTFGTFMPIPEELTELRDLYTQMEATVTPMPVGPARSMALVFLGNNIAMSLTLACAALVLWRMRQENSRDRWVLACNGALLLGVGVISSFCFFPVPAVFTSVAGVLSLFVAFNKGTPTA